MKPEFETKLIWGLLAGLIIPLIQIYRVVPSYEIEFYMIFPFLLLIATLLLSLLLRYRQSLGKFIEQIQVLGRNKKIIWISSLIILQFGVASICYWIYQDHPSFYILGDEVERGYQTVAKEKWEEDFKNVQQYGQGIERELGIFKYIRAERQSLRQSPDGQIHLNDSLIIATTHTYDAGQDHLIVNIYGKETLINFSSFHSFHYEKIEFDSAIESWIKSCEARMSDVAKSLKSKQPYDPRWSFLHFLNFYFKNELDAVTPFLIILDFLKYSIWFVISMLLASRLWKKAKIPEKVAGKTS